MVTEGEIKKARSIVGILDTAAIAARAEADRLRAERPWLRTDAMFPAHANGDRIFDDARLVTALEHADAQRRALAQRARDALASLAEYRAARSGTRYDDERRDIYDRIALFCDLRSEPHMRRAASHVLSQLGELMLVCEVDDAWSARARTFVAELMNSTRSATK